MKRLLAPAFLVFATSLGLALLVGWLVPPVWQVEAVELPVHLSADGRPEIEGVALEGVVGVEDAVLWPLVGRAGTAVPQTTPEVVRVGGEVTGNDPAGDRYFRVTPRRHWGAWSLLPAAVAIALCFLTREPLTALGGAVLVGALLMGHYDVTGAVLIPALASNTAATVLVLYLWFLGGLLGIWSATGAAAAFADWATRHLVRGPVTAKLVAWVLGVVFFQGGTLSTVLVGTTVRPIADRQRVSHEELAYIVDSTASPIAILLPFNAWPLYVQGLIFVSGAGFLATQADRLAFFFASIPLSFYALFSVIFTLLLAFDRLPVAGRQLREAVVRARSTGELNSPTAEPLAAAELEAVASYPGYATRLYEFLVPIALIIGTTVLTYALMGSPQVLWGFAGGLLAAMGMALWRGMPLEAVIAGFTRGLKGVVYGSAVLLLAVVVGGVSRDAGGGLFLVEMLGDRVPYWLLPVLLQLTAMVIAFSTGTSWGTYAVTFPLAMPLAWAVGSGLQDPQLFTLVCFAATLNGAVYGDQCSPISDTTVLSSMATGCDLMDHVRTQISPASVAAALAAVGWTVMALVAA